MKSAWLITNHFLVTPKMTEIYQWLIVAAEKKGIRMDHLTNCQGSDRINQGISEEERPDFILFWDKDIYLAKQMEMMGFKLYNSSRAIEICDDKGKTYLALKGDSEVLMPKTFIAPGTFQNIGYTDLSFVDLSVKKLGLPIVIKECFGSFGQQVYLAGTGAEAKSIINTLGGRPFLFQEFIKTSVGRDLRVNVVGERVECAMLRYNDTGDFRSNISNGGKMENITINKDQERLAIKVCKSIGVDFAGVDIMYGKGGTPVLCEVNSNMHFKSSYDCTGVNLADKIIEYIYKDRGWYDERVADLRKG